MKNDFEKLLDQRMKTSSEIDKLSEYYFNLQDDGRIDIKDYQKTYFNKVHDASEFASKFREYLFNVPVSVAVDRWLHLCKSNRNIDVVLADVKRLIDADILPTKTANGKIVDLHCFDMIDQSYQVQCIRCIPGVTQEEAERMVETYLDFMQHLFSETWGYVRHEGDPDRIAVADKRLHYEKFIDFSRRLSQRDSLIAHLIYFGDCSMSNIIELRVKDIDLPNCEIIVEDRHIKFSPHVIIRLKDLIASKKPDELAFTNRTGGKVNRSRLYRSFKNAGAKMSSPTEILPSTLLEKK